MNSLWIIIVFVVTSSSALKCQSSDDGITEEDVRRIVRVCMRKIGDNTYGDSSDYAYPESDEYSSDRQTDSEDRNDRRYSEDDYRQRNRDHFRSPSGAFRNGGGGEYGDYEGHSRNDGGDRSRTQNVSLTDKQAERDRACIVHCFFQEMKMTNDRQLPDKHKVIQVITKDLRDKQLKEFYINSIQECFYIIEFDQHRPGKCEFSSKLIRCLAERAQSNCDDWDNHTILF